MTTVAQNLLGVDLVLELTLKGFDGEQVQHKHMIIAERGLSVPLTREGVVIEGRKVPVNGAVEYKLAISDVRERVVDEIQCDIKKSLFLVHHLKGLFNGTQELLVYIPVIGKALAKIIPDAKQKVDVAYSLYVSDDRRLFYKVTIGRLKKPAKSIISQGEFQL